MNGKPSNGLGNSIEVFHPRTSTPRTATNTPGALDQALRYCHVGRSRAVVTPPNVAEDVVVEVDVVVAKDTAVAAAAVSNDKRPQQQVPHLKRTLFK